MSHNVRGDRMPAPPGNDSSIRVCTRPQILPSASPVQAGPISQAVKKCCCINTGSMTIGCQADRSYAVRGESLGLNIVARNDSPTTVDKLHIEVMQNTTWVARGHRSKRQHAVATIIVPGPQLGNVGQGIGAGNERKNSFQRIAAEAQEELGELLTQGAGARHELTIVDKALVGMDTPLIKVSHVLSVRLQTPCCVVNPEVSMPLDVHGAHGALTPVAVECTSLELRQDGGVDSGPPPPSYIDHLQRTNENMPEASGYPVSPATGAPDDTGVFRAYTLPPPSISPTPSTSRVYPN